MRGCHFDGDSRNYFPFSDYRPTNEFYVWINFTRLRSWAFRTRILTIGEIFFALGDESISPLQYCRPYWFQIQCKKKQSFFTKFCYIFCFKGIITFLFIYLIHWDCSSFLSNFIFLTNICFSGILPVDLEWSLQPIVHRRIGSLLWSCDDGNPQN